MIHDLSSGINLLSIIVRVERIELSPQPWEGRVLPLNHTRNLFILLYAF